MTPIVWLTRLLVGAYPQWMGCNPSHKQRIYFANHTSHLDTVVIWTALPGLLRRVTRPVAAKDYWDHGLFRKRLAMKELNVVLIDRNGLTAFLTTHAGVNSGFWPRATPSSFSRKAPVVRSRCRVNLKAACGV